MILPVLSLPQLNAKIRDSKEIIKVFREERPFWRGQAKSAFDANYCGSSQKLALLGRDLLVLQKFVPDWISTVATNSTRSWNTGKLAVMAEPFHRLPPQELLKMRSGAENFAVNKSNHCGFNSRFVRYQKLALLSRDLAVLLILYHS